MIARSHRFHGYNSLRSVYERGQTVRGSVINLKYSRRDQSRPYRVAVVVSRKVSKSAVTRNRIRRRIYEIVRGEASQLNGYDLVFTVFNESFAILDAGKLSAQIQDLIKKACH